MSRFRACGVLGRCSTKFRFHSMSEGSSRIVSQSLWQFLYTHTHTHPFLEVSLSPPEMLFFAAFGMERLELRSLSAQKFVGLSDLDGSFLSLFLCELSPCPGDTLYVQTQYIQTRIMTPPCHFFLQKSNSMVSLTGPISGASA